MKREDIKKAFDKIQPDEHQRQRILGKVLNQAEKREKISFIKNLKTVSVTIALLVFVIGGALGINYLANNGPKPGNELGDSALVGNGDEGFENKNEDLAGKENAADDNIDEDTLTTEQYDIAPERMVYFILGSKIYTPLSDSYRLAYNLPHTINQDDIGERVATIFFSSHAPYTNKDLEGLDVYAYKPAGSQAVLAVKKDNEYLLYMFSYFESYENNKDEDAARYLELYGIRSADDIDKIQIIGHGNEGWDGQNDSNAGFTITKRSDLAKFYTFYSVLKDSSKKYFETLGLYVGSPDAPDSVTDWPDDFEAIDEREDTDYVVDGMEDPSYILPYDPPEGDEPVANTGEGFTGGNEGSTVATEGIVEGSAGSAEGTTAEGSAGSAEGTTAEGSAGSSGHTGSDVLDGSITIRIYNQKGVYMETEFYPNINFISRHEISKEFAAFLTSFIG